VINNKDKQLFNIAIDKIKNSKEAIEHLLTLAIDSENVSLDDAGNPYCSHSGETLTGVELVFED
jgi:hypothetical protein